MKRFLIVVFLGLMAGTASAQEIPERLSLQQAVEIAIRNNITVAQSATRVEAADIDRKQAKANMLPSLNADFNYGWNNGRSIDPFQNIYVNQQLQGSNVSVSGSWNLFNGLQVQNNMKQTRFAHEATKMELQQAKDQLTINVIIAYLQVLSGEDLLLNLESQALVTKNQVERLQVLVSEGARGQYQLSDMKGQYANDQVSIVTAKNSLDIARITLCQLMNIPISKTLQLERNDAPFPQEPYGATPEIIYANGKNLPGIKATDLRVESAKRAIAVEKGAFMPRIGLYGNLFSNYSSAAETRTLTGTTDVTTDNYVLVNSLKTNVISPQSQFASESISYNNQMKNNIGSGFGVAASIPIFNNLRTKYRVDQAKVQLKAAELEKAQTDLTLRQNIEQAYANMESAYNRYKAVDEQYREYAESFRANEIRFNEGVINSFEYLQAKNNLDRARLNLTQIRYEYIFRTKILDYFQGKLSF
jgi:outer membrane protein